jgi:hypothetical protein
MYNRVYSSLMDAGTSIKVEEEIMYNKFGVITINWEEMFGRPTKYENTKTRVRTLCPRDRM